MTNERAVEILNLDLDILGQYGGETAEAYKMAIQALEAQPSEDCISRQAVLDTIGNVPDHNDGMVFEALSHAQRDVALLPSVTPRRDLALTSQDCISREEVQDLISRWLSDYLLDETREALETINYKVGDMPSVTPKAEPCEDCISILNRIMEYTYGMLTAEKIGLQHLIKSMIDEMSGGGEDEVSN